MLFASTTSYLNKYRKDHPFVFYFLLLYLGSILTYIIIFLIWHADHSKPMALNEVGDFLAGAFSPIAFLFLYLGYRQNSEALRIQGEELKANTRALELQINEMQASVLEQKVMSDLLKTELEEKHNSVMPILDASCKLGSNSNPTKDGDDTIYYLKFTLVNIGSHDVRNIKLDLGDRLEFSSDLITTKESISFTEKLNQAEIDFFKSGKDFERVINLTFQNILGRSFNQAYVYQLSFDKNKQFQQTLSKVF